MKKILQTSIAILGLSTGTMAQAPSYVPTNGLVGWWGFNGNANDESGNGYNGTVSGATLTTDRFGNINSAYEFDGVNDFISTNRLAEATIAFSGWYYLNKNQQYSPIIDANNANWEILIEFLSPTFIKWIETPGNYHELVSNTSTGTGQWYHLVCNYTGTKATFYLNGDSIESFTRNSTPINTNGTYYFGASISGTSQYLNGKLDDIGIWNRELSKDEITALYNSTTLSLNETSGNNLFTLYPNPTESEIKLKADATLLNTSYIIYDNTGKSVLTGKITSENSIIELGNLTNGIYLFSIGGKSTKSFKILKK